VGLNENVEVEGRGKADRLRRVLEDCIWPWVPPEVLGKPVSKAEVERILGFGPDGV
jgi:antitoxin VapB